MWNFWVKGVSSRIALLSLSCGNLSPGLDGVEFLCVAVLEPFEYEKISCKEIDVLRIGLCSGSASFVVLYKDL